MTEREFVLRYILAKTSDERGIPDAFMESNIRQAKAIYNKVLENTYDL